jgi:hypothetical protein
MRRFGIGVLFAIGGYAVAAFAGYFLMMQFSPNMHDRSVEAGMTSAFVFGPTGVVIGFVIGVVWSGRPNATGTDK